MNPKSTLQEAQDFIHKAHFHLKQVNSSAPEGESCRFALDELEKAQQKIQQAQERINE